MNIAHRILVGLMLLCVAVPTVAAQNEETASREALEEAREIAYWQIDALADKIADNFRVQAWPQIERDLNGRYDRATLDELLDELATLQKKNVLAAINDTAPLYARRFTVEELREINAYIKSPQKDEIAFNGSSVGRKLWWVTQELIPEIEGLLAAKKEQIQAQTLSVFRKVLRGHGYIK